MVCCHYRATRHVKEFFMNYKVFLIIFFVSLALSCRTSSEVAVKDSELTDLEIVRQDSVIWSRAGIKDTFVPSHERELTDTLMDVANIQSQLNRLFEQGGGRLIVPAGDYLVHSTIRIPSNVSMIGLDRERSIFRIMMMEVFETSKHLNAPRGNASAFLLEGVSNASIENLTIIYNAVDFEPHDFEAYDHPWVRDVFHGSDSLTENLYVTSVWFEGAENCLITRCNILKAGNDPIRLQHSSHITLSHNYVDRAYNKGGGGAGYYNLINSHHCLLFEESIQRIRHLSIHYGSSYNVVYGCRLQTDVNFHNGDKGHNLIENNTIRIPHWHSWRPFGTGSANMHKPPGPYSVLFRNITDHKSTGPETDPEILYFMSPYFPDRSLGQSKFIETTLAGEFPNGIFDPSRHRK
jgi:hypothetical protein